MVFKLIFIKIGGPNKMIMRGENLKIANLTPVLQLGTTGQLYFQRST